jgi:hypothetical protein
MWRLQCVRESAVNEFLALPAGMRASMLICLGVLMTCAPHSGIAQAGPPFLSNDPGTPGNGNWEINVAAAQTVGRASSSYQLPQLDVNFGLGDRVQLTYEVPYVVETDQSTQSSHAGWSNAYPGVKWRFIDQGEGGWQVSLFPQIETGSALSAQQQRPWARSTWISRPVISFRSAGRGRRYSGRSRDTRSPNAWTSRWSCTAITSWVRNRARPRPWISAGDTGCRAV